LGGTRQVNGLNGLTAGDTADPAVCARALQLAAERGFISTPPPTEE
jgi:hypothetical protein